MLGLKLIHVTKKGSRLSNCKIQSNLAFLQILQQGYLFQILMHLEMLLKPAETWFGQPITVTS